MKQLVLGIQTWTGLSNARKPLQGQEVMLLMFGNIFVRLLLVLAFHAKHRPVAVCVTLPVDSNIDIPVSSVSKNSLQRINETDEKWFLTEISERHKSQYFIIIISWQSNNKIRSYSSFLTISRPTLSVFISKNNQYCTLSLDSCVST